MDKVKSYKDLLGAIVFYDDTDDTILCSKIEERKINKYHTEYQDYFLKIENNSESLKHVLDNFLEIEFEKLDEPYDFYDLDAILKDMKFSGLIQFKYNEGDEDLEENVEECYRFEKGLLKITQHAREYSNMISTSHYYYDKEERNLMVKCKERNEETEEDIMMHIHNTFNDKGDIIEKNTYTYTENILRLHDKILYNEDCITHYINNDIDELEYMYESEDGYKLKIRKFPGAPRVVFYELTQELEDMTIRYEFKSVKTL